MNIGITNDHHGVTLKQELTKFLTRIGYNVIDYGTNEEESIDYPTLAFNLGEDVVSKKIDYGISICMTGIGMSIALNKVKGVRCAKVVSKEEACLTRSHNDANVIAISSKQNIEELKEIVETFLETRFSNEERHIRRVNLIRDYENK